MNDRQVENLIDVLEDMTFAIKLGSIMIVITIPEDFDEEEIADNIPEEINGDTMEVKFNSWLNTNQSVHKSNNNWSNWELELFWERNFYPNIQVIANDLYKKGLIEAGEYCINIDW